MAAESCNKNRIIHNSAINHQLTLITDWLCLPAYIITQPVRSTGVYIRICILVVVTLWQTKLSKFKIDHSNRDYSQSTTYTVVEFWLQLVTTHTTCIAHMTHNHTIIQNSVIVCPIQNTASQVFRIEQIWTSREKSEFDGNYTSLFELIQLIKLNCIQRWVDPPWS